MIEFQHVTKSLSGRRVLDDLSIDIKDGETFCIVGPSGTGKSVTLNHIIGLFQADSGRVLVDGQDIASLNFNQLETLRLKMGMLFQSGALLNWMNIYDNIALPLRETRKMKENEIGDLVMETLDLLEIADAATRMPSELSGGMIKRAALARAVVRQPKIMLYDEPTSGLDPVISRKIDSLIVTLQKKFSMTSVVVTHDLRSAFTIANRIAMLHSGKIVECGTREEFKNSNNHLVQEFISAQFNFNLGESKHE